MTHLKTKFRSVEASMASDMTAAAAKARLQKRLDELKGLSGLPANDPKFDAAELNIRGDVKQIFGKISHEYDFFKNYKICYPLGGSLCGEVRRKGVERALQHVESLIVRVDELDL